VRKRKCEMMRMKVYALGNGRNMSSIVKLWSKVMECNELVLLSRRRERCRARMHSFRGVEIATKPVQNDLQDKRSGGRKHSSRHLQDLNLRGKIPIDF
jgi:hypothetical protein